jgi:hypothetical protein
MVGNRGLGEVEERDQLADADLAGVLAEDVDELHAYRVAKGLGHCGHAFRLGPLDVRVDDRLAARLAHGTLLLGSELQIDRHRYTYID